MITIVILIYRTYDVGKSMFSNLSAYNLFYLPMLTHFVQWHQYEYLGVSKNRCTPKWMVYKGKPLLKWMIWGYPLFLETPISWYSMYFPGSYNPWSWSTPRQLLSPWRLWAYSRQVQRVDGDDTAIMVFFLEQLGILNLMEFECFVFFKFGFQNENWGGSNWWVHGFFWIHFLCRWEHGLFRRSWTSLCGCQNS